MLGIMRSQGMVPANLACKSTAGISWSKAVADHAACRRFGMRPTLSFLPQPSFGTRWHPLESLDAYGRQVRAFRPSAQPLNLRPTVRATAASRSQVLQSRRVQGLQSDISADSESSKPTVRRLLALLWPDRILLGVALCFLVGAAVSQVGSITG